jgi:hypothetical protein
VAITRLEASDFDFDRDRAEPVGDVIRRWVKRSGMLASKPREKFDDAWQRLLGPDAAHTRLEALKQRGPSAGVAHVVVDSSALLSELAGFRKAELLDGLRREMGGYFVQDIRFRLEKRGRPRGPRRTR